MSPDELADVAAEHGDAAYVISTRDDGRSHLVHVVVTVVDGVVRCRVGSGTAAALQQRPTVVLLWPQVSPDGYSLIADGTAVVDGDELAIDVSGAVRHRPPPRD